ncbi:potassium channel family protein [Ulvibacterium sp.]|uniref:potassium channel family protein n=1 Tax=Ulvibacterium sp. TaxID=2665914 RepID=UPI003BAA975E
MKRKILKVFILFLVVQIAFSIVYFHLYKSYNQNFFFLNEILKNQVSKIKENLNQEILDIHSRYSDLRKDSISISKRIDYSKYAESLIQKTGVNELEDNINDLKLTSLLDTLYDFKLIDPVGSKGMTPPGTQGEQQLVFEFLSYNNKTLRLQNRFGFETSLKANQFNRRDYYRLSEERKNLILESLESFQTSAAKALDEKLSEVLSAKVSKEKMLEELELKNANVWSYWDFLYFSFTKISNSDILPNSSTTRVVVTFQILIEIFIVGFLITIVAIKKDT